MHDTGNTFDLKHTTDEYPIVFNRFNCQGNEARLYSCGSGVDAYIQYCTTNAVEITCGG